MPDHNYFANLIWQIADLLRGPYRPPQYERVMLPMTILRRFDCVLAPTKAQVLAEHARRKGGKLEGDALDTKLNEVASQRFHNHSPLDFEKLKGDQAVVHHAARATAQLWIESPLDRDQAGEGKKGSWLNRAFDTHPPLDERIAVLKAM